MPAPAAPEGQETGRGQVGPGEEEARAGGGGRGRGHGQGVRARRGEVHAWRGDCASVGGSGRHGMVQPRRVARRGWTRRGFSVSGRVVWWSGGGDGASSGWEVSRGAA
jgi:hypothetical protein